MATATKPQKELPAHVKQLLAGLPESGNVTVGCKLPNGLILRLFDMAETEELVLGGGVRTINRAVLKDVGPVTIKGCAAPFGTPVLTVGGYAFTHNVDAQFYAEWVRQNWDSDIVKNHLIFAQAEQENARSQGQDQGEILSGLQPLSQDRDPRAPRKVEPADLKDAA